MVLLVNNYQLYGSSKEHIMGELPFLEEPAISLFMNI